MMTWTCQSRCGRANCRCVSQPARRSTIRGYWLDSGRAPTSRDIPGARKLQMGRSEALRRSNSTVMSDNCQTVASRCGRKTIGYSIELSGAIAGERGLTRDVDVGRADARKVVAAFD